MAQAARITGGLSLDRLAGWPKGWHLHEMLRRTHDDGAVASEAIYSDCGAYRYSLTRRWDSSGKRLVFVMLNPSVADERRNDPTVERCERRARLWRFGAFRVVNIFALRATDPMELRIATDPEGPETDNTLNDAVDWADQVIAAWGVHGALHGRGSKVAGNLAATGTPLFHLGLTKAGHPRHPLYVPYSRPPERWHLVAN
jgi:hypothetical protein